MNKYLIQPKFSVGDRVIHKSNPEVVMIIKSEVFEKAQIPTAFGTGINFTSKGFHFDGYIICEWMDNNQIFEEKIHQDMLDPA